jgi:hypothetical protein
LSRIVTQGDLEPQPYEAVGHSRSRPSPHYNAHRSPAYIYVDNDPLPRPVQPSPREDLGGPAIDPSGVQGLLLQDGLSVVEKRIREFREMRDRASDLGDWVRNSSQPYKLASTEIRNRISRKSTPTKTAKKQLSTPSQS